MKFTCKDILLSQFSTLFFAIRNKSNTKFLKSYFSNSDHHNILWKIDKILNFSSAIQPSMEYWLKL